MKPTLIALCILALVLCLGGWKSVRGAFARDAVHEITRTLFKSYR